MADAVEAVRQGVEQEAPDELVGAESHDLRLAMVAIVLPAEGDFSIGHADQTRVGDGDPMGIAAEISQHLRRSAEGRLGIDHPVDPTKFAEPANEGGGLCQFDEIAEEAEITGLERGAQLVEEQPAEEA